MKSEEKKDAFEPENSAPDSAELVNGTEGSTANVIGLESEAKEGQAAEAETVLQSTNAEESESAQEEAISTEEKETVNPGEEGSAVKSSDGLGKKFKIMLVASIVLIVLGVVGIVITQYMISQREPLAIGQKYLDSMRYEDALNAFLPILHEDGENETARTGSLKAYISLGTLAHENGNYQLATQQFLLALLLDEQNSEAIAGAANAQIALGEQALEALDFESAQAYFERSLSMEADNLTARKELGQASLTIGNELLQDKKYEEALINFEKAIMYAPNEEDGYTGAAKACEALEQSAILYSLTTNHDSTANEFIGLLDVDEINVEKVHELLRLQLTSDADTDLGRYYGDLDEEGIRNGKGCAYYSNGRVYYGEWIDGKREGYGVWLDLMNDKLQYAGSWKNDLPDGEFTAELERKLETESPDEEDVSEMLFLEGSCAKGLFNGTIKSQLTQSSGTVPDCCTTTEIEYNNGEVVAVGEEVYLNESIVHVFTCPEGHDAYVFKDGSYGILGFADSLVWVPLTRVFEQGGGEEP